MTERYEIDGTDYELNGNPSLGTVREVQKMQLALIRDYIDEDNLTQMESLSDEQVVQAIMDSGGFEAFQEVMWERSLLDPIQTISLAADDVFDSDDFEDMPANDFKEIRESAEEALGGDSSDFFEGLGIGLSLSDRQMEQARQMQ